MRGQRFQSPLDQLMSKVIPEPNSGCWLWLGATTGTNGYGRLAVGGRNGRDAYAHRLSYELHVGPIGDLHVLHKCDNRVCVNPDHLRLGTNRDNVHDKVAKSRQLRGSTNPSAKLTEADVFVIRAAYAEGATQRSLAERYGVSREQIGAIVRYDRWRHV